MIQTLVVDGWQPTLLNDLLRMDRHARGRALHLDAEVVGGEARRQRLARARGRRRASLTIRYTAAGEGDVDPDALFKSLLDGLRKARLLLDDNRRWLELGPVRHELAGRKGIVVLLEDLEEGA